MANEFYDHGAVPATGSSLSSATIRAEFDAIEAGFDKLPTLAGQAGKLVKVNAGATGLDTTDAPDINGGTIDGAVIGGTSPAAGTFTNLTATGNTVIGNAATDTVTVVADVASSLIPSADNTHDLGAVGSEWRDLYITGTANIDSLVADTADVNGGTIDGATIGATTRAAGNFTTLNANGSVVLGDAAADTVTINGTVQPGVVVSGSSTGDALRITQTGTGNALVVEDEANPDTTPFVVGSSGQVIRGHTATINLANPDTGTANGPQLESVSTGVSGASVGSVLYVNSAGQAGYYALAKSRGATIGDMTALQSGDTIGFLSWQGSDGASFIRAADIQAEVDGTPGLNDMPGRLVFSTTPSGSGTPVEAMRIDSARQVGIGVAPSAGHCVTLAKDVTGAASAFALRARNVVASDVSDAFFFATFPSTQAASFTLASLTHFLASQNTFGVGSSITNQYGFSVSNNLTGATNNYGFYSNIAAATGRWNFYANGTAANYFAGNVGIGSSAASNKLDVRNGQALFTRSSLGSNITAPADAELSLLSNVATSSTGTQQITLHSDRQDRWSAIGHYRDTLSGRIGLSFFTSNDEAAPVERLRLTHTGGLQINRTAVTAPAASDGNVFSGTYTPTLTNVANVASSTAYLSSYMRVGNVVTAAYCVGYTASAAGNVDIGISLPVPSNFATGGDACGAASSTNSTSGFVYADITNDRLNLRLVVSSTAASTAYFSVTYRVI